MGALMDAVCRLGVNIVVLNHDGSFQGKLIFGNAHKIS
jgi:hypothetical protein